MLTIDAGRMGFIDDSDQVMADGKLLDSSKVRGASERTENWPRLLVAVWMTC